MTDKVRKVFELLGVEPNEEFKIKDSGGNERHHRYFFDEDLTLKFIDNHSGEWLFASDGTFIGLVKGTLKIIKLPKKKKLRDITPEEWETWLNNSCMSEYCHECLFENVYCFDSKCKKCWVHNKDLYSDKFLDQEIEVEDNE